MSLRTQRPTLRRIGTGAWNAVPAALAAGVLFGVALSLVAMATVGGSLPAAGGYVAVLSGVALGVVEAVRLVAAGATLLRRRSWDGGWLSLAGWLLEIPLVLVVLGFLGAALYITDVASRSTPGVGLGMTLVLFAVFSLLAMVPLALLVLGRVGARATG